MSEWLKEALAVAGIAVVLAMLALFTDAEQPESKAKDDDPRFIDEDEIE